MRPSRNHPPVERYVHPDVFEQYVLWGREAGLEFVFSAPLVRSSYNAAHVFEQIKVTR
jgi:lipoic acid synthetase